MSTMINWPVLVDSGRAKSIGISWSEEELHAIHHLKIPVEYVRNGVLTLEQYGKDKVEVEEHEKKEKKKPLRYMSKPALLEEAKSLGINAVPIATRPDLIMLIEDKLKQLTKVSSVGHVDAASSRVE